MKKYKGFNKYNALWTISDQDITLPIDEMTVECDGYEDNYKYTFINLKMLFQNARFVYRNKRRINRIMDIGLIKIRPYSIKDRTRYYDTKQRSLRELARRRF